MSIERQTTDKLLSKIACRIRECERALQKAFDASEQRDAKTKQLALRQLEAAAQNLLKVCREPVPIEEMKKHGNHQHL